MSNFGTVDYDSKSWQQGYWVGRNELRDEHATAPHDSSYMEGVIMGSSEIGVNFHIVPEYHTAPYTPQLHTLRDLENDLVNREDDEE